MKVVFCLPGAPTLHAAMSWDSLLVALPGMGVHAYIVRGYNSSVVHCRNELLEVGVKGLSPDTKPFAGLADFDYDFLMWIDSDSVYTPSDFKKLLDLNVDIATGLVPVDPQGRGAVGQFNDWKAMQYLDLRKVPQDKPPFEVGFCGFAFLLVRKGVFEALEYPWFDEVSYTIDNLIVLPGEDFRWCMKVHEKGFKIVAHPSVRIGHEKRVIMETPGPLASGAQGEATRGNA